MSIYTRIHDSLWDTYEQKHDDVIVVDGREHQVGYQDYQSPPTNRARAVIDGVIWESQNMKKIISADTRHVRDTPGLKISWGFKHDGDRIKWLTKITSQDEDGWRTTVVEDLQHHKVVEQAVESVD